MSESRFGWSWKIVALASSLLASALVLDLLVRLSGVDTPLLWRPHPTLGWVHIPGARVHWTDEGDGWVRINNQGMRDIERTTPRQDGVFRIAVFGDSMTEGVQVNLDQIFTQQLESLLRSEGRRVEVLNFGVSGYSPLQGYLMYREQGVLFKPDLVLHCVFTDNDVADGVPELAAGQVGAPFITGLSTSSQPLKVDYSRAIEATQDYDREPVRFIREWSAVYRAVGTLRRRVAVLKQAGANTGSGVPKRYELYLASPPKRWAEAWTRLLTIEREFSREAQSRGSMFAIVSVPAGASVDREAWNALLRKSPAMTTQDWAVDGPNNRLRVIAQELGVEIVDPLDLFRARLSSGPLFFGGFGHFTPAGHKVMAEALSDWLKGKL